MSEEQLKLLRMIEEHKISAEEGAKLLTALNDAQAARGRGEGAGRRKARTAPGSDNDLFWGRRAEVRDQLSDARAQLLEERERLREVARQVRDEARQVHDDARRRTRSLRTEPLGEAALGSQARFFRVRVSNRETGATEVDLRLPLALVNFGLKVGAKYLPAHITLDNEEVLEAVRSGALGKILEVNDSGGGARVEIIIES